MSKSLLLLAALMFFGCSSLPREENAFSFPTKTGVRTIKVSKARLERLRSQWTSDSSKVAKTSKLRSEDRQWTLDFIALENERLTQCRLNDLHAVTQRPLGDPVQVQVANQTMKPALYNEIWSVESCNRHGQWQINDFDNNLSVAPLQ
jgi:hypothetical protein